MLSTKIFAALAVLAVADFASHTVSAADLSAEVGQVKISYADLDLSAPQGAAVMANRIRNAARTICGGGEMSYRDMTQRRLAKACVSDTSARAAAQHRAPLVTAMLGGADASVVQVAAR
jgi:UrcA family protein